MGSEKEKEASAASQEALRSQLSKLDLVAFVGNGAVLPRKSGVDDRPMTKKDSSNLAPWQKNFS